MPQAKGGTNLLAGRNRQYATNGLKSVGGDNAGAVVQGRIFKEDARYQIGTDLGIDKLPGTDVLFQFIVAGDHDQGTSFRF